MPKFMSKFSELPKKRKFAWLYFALFLMASFAMLPVSITDAEMDALISGICLGVAAMIALFRLGKKEAGEVE